MFFAFIAILGICLKLKSFAFLGSTFWQIHYTLQSSTHLAVYGLTQIYIILGKISTWLIIQKKLIALLAYRLWLQHIPLVHYPLLINICAAFVILKRIKNLCHSAIKLKHTCLTWLATLCSECCKNLATGCWP